MLKSKLMSRLQAKRRQLGQGMSEYMIITALIAVAAIGVVGLLGGVISNQMASMATELAGGDGSAANTAAGTQGTSAVTNAGTEKTLANFASANNGGGGGGPGGPGGPR